MKHIFHIIIFVISTVYFTTVSAIEPQNGTDINSAETIQEIPASLSNPRATMTTFLSAMKAVSDGKKQQIKEAVTTLDLSEISPLIRESKGEDLARILYSVIERSKKVELAKIPKKPANGQYIFGHYSQGNVEIVKQNDGRWLFSKETIDALPAVLEGLLEKPAKHGAKNPQEKVPFAIRLRAEMPDSLKGGFLLEYWQWLSIFIIVILGSIADKFVAWLLAVNVTRWKNKQPGFHRLDSHVLRPLGLMAMALIWWVGLGALGLPETALVILSIAVKLLTSLSGVWSAYRLVDVIYAYLLHKAKGTANKFDDLLVPMICKSLKVFVTVIGIIFIADNLNVDVTSLLAGLGLGGLAFALAAKDLLGNFFGSVTVLLDRPFHIGDWVIVGDVEGAVETVGFRTTRIRTFYDSVVTLPNSTLTNTKIDNMGVRRFRRLKMMLGVTYDTSPEKIDAFCEGIRTLVKVHPYMRKDYYQVYFNQYNAASLDILVYVFWKTPDWNTELRERHRFLLDILRLAKQLGVEFAYPTQTIYLKQEGASSDAEMTQSYQPKMSENDAFAMGKQQAEAIVDSTLGLGVKPDPVKYPKK